MKKIFEVISTFFLAVRYSLSFCWRNAKALTIGRIITVLIDSFIAYSFIWIVGHIINVSTQLPKSEQMHFFDFIKSELGQTMCFFAGIVILGVINSRYKWLFRSRWHEELRFANKYELQGHRIKLDIARFASKEFDDLAKQIDDIPGSWGTRIGFADEMLTLLSVILTLATFGGSLFVYSPVYFFIILVSSLPIMVGDFRIINLWWGIYIRMVPHNKKRQVLERSYHNKEAFIQAQMFNQKDPLRKDIARSIDLLKGTYSVIRRASIRSEFLTHSIANIGFITVSFHIVWSAAQGGIAWGSLMVLITSARQFLGSIEGAVGVLSEQWNSARGVILIEKDFFGLKPVLMTPNPINSTQWGKNYKPDVVEVRNISFSYPSSNTIVLKNINFTIKRGQKIAVVGKSGSGKSSLFSLLARHYDPVLGEIIVDGVSLSRIPPEVWVEYISGLTQDYYIVPRTIEKEIASSRLGQPIDREDVAEAAHFSNFTGVANSKPKGFKTQIGTEFEDDHAEFSGGEKTRLALARVKYRNTPILMLDEPDAKLDPETAEVVMDNIFALTGVTVVLITHHVSRAARCDNIILLDKGEIAEMGTHVDLMARGGKYTTMFTKDKERLNG